MRPLAAVLAVSAALLAGRPAPPSTVHAQPAPCFPGTPPEECPLPFPSPAPFVPGSPCSGPIVTICSSDGTQCVTVGLPGPNNPNPRVIATATPVPTLVADLVISTGAFQSVVTPSSTVQFSTSIFNGGPNAAVGGSVAFTATVTLIPGVLGQVSNTATVEPPPGVADSNLANNSATATITIAP